MKWEYKTHVVAKTFLGGKMKTQTIDEVMNRYGQEGWELSKVLYNVNIAWARDGILLFFKRPLPENK